MDLDDGNDGILKEVDEPEEPIGAVHVSTPLDRFVYVLDPSASISEVHPCGNVFKNQK